MEWFSITDKGKIRRKNEDSISFLVKEGRFFAVVADGLGGENGGEIASSMAVEKLEKFFKDNEYTDEEKLEKEISHLSLEIFHAGENDENLTGMGTTLTCFILHEKSLLWCHVGDSRLWIFREGHLSQLSTDHRFIQDLIDDGTITDEDAKTHPLRHVLDQCLGLETVSPESGHVEVFENDIILLSSDGLHDYVETNLIGNILSTGSSMEDICNRLLEKALDAGGKDNISIIALRV